MLSVKRREEGYVESDGGSYVGTPPELLAYNKLQLRVYKGDSDRFQVGRALPQGWERKMQPDNSEYYENALTGETSPYPPLRDSLADLYILDLQGNTMNKGYIPKGSLLKIKNIERKLKGVSTDCNPFKDEEQLNPDLSLIHI